MPSGQALHRLQGDGAPSWWQLRRQALVTTAVMDGLQATPAVLQQWYGWEEMTTGRFLELLLVLQLQFGGGLWQLHNKQETELLPQLTHSARCPLVNGGCPAVDFRDDATLTVGKVSTLVGLIFG
jgi:hypothetical protein